MGTINLGFGDVKGFEPLPEGTYDLIVNTVTSGKGAKGPYLKFEYGILPEEEYGKRKLFDIYSLSQDALWKLQGVLEAITGTPWRDNNMDLDPNDLVGLQCKGVVYQEEYEKRILNKIRNILPTDDESPSVPARRVM